MRIDAPEPTMASSRSDLDDLGVAISTASPTIAECIKLSTWPKGCRRGATKSPLVVVVIVVVVEICETPDDRASDRRSRCAGRAEERPGKFSEIDLWKVRSDVGPPADLTG